MSRLFTIPETLDSDSWYTPPWVFDGLGLTFDLDVASPNPPPDWIPARDFYSESDNGLLQPWDGMVWCNPPYSDPVPWCDRWSGHPDGMLLVRCDLSTGGTFRAFTAADGIYVPRRRLSFVNAVAVPTRPSAASFSSVLMSRGTEATDGLFRLAASHGGTARRLNS